MNLNPQWLTPGWELRFIFGIPHALVIWSHHGWYPCGFPCLAGCGSVVADAPEGFPNVPFPQSTAELICPPCRDRGELDM